MIPTDELLEIWDWEKGIPTGKPVSRKESHRQGIPHEGVHLWILSTSEGFPELLFQHRAPHKEHYPDCLDITVGGHVPFGLTEKKIHKEALEEIGIDLKEEALIDLGYFRYEEKNDSLFHREFQHVYLLNDNRSLDWYCFNDNEVIGIYAIPLSGLQELMVHQTAFNVHGFNGSAMLTKQVTRKDFHPQLFAVSMREYMDVVIQACMELASG